MRPRISFLAPVIVVILLVTVSGCQIPGATDSPTSTPTPSTPVVSPVNPVTPSAVQPSTTPSPTPTPKPSVLLAPARFVLGDLTITPTAVMAGEKVTYSIQVSNIGGTEGSYTVVFKYKSSRGSIGSDNVEVTLKPGQTKTATLTTTKNEPGTYFVSVNDKGSQYTVTPVPKPIQGVPATSACAITSPPPIMEGINTHTELYGTGADPDIITLGPKVGGHPGWPTYKHKCGMSFEAYKRGTPVLAPFDMVLVGFRDTSTQVLSGGTSAHADDVKLFFESASPDWPGVYMTVYHLLTSPLLTGHTQSASNDLAAPPAQGYQLFWDGNYTLSPTGNAASYGALIGYKVKRGELIGFAGTVPTPDGVGHSFADFYFDVPDTSINPNIKSGNRNLHLVQPGSFFYWKSFSPSATFPAGVLAYPFECDGYQLPAEQRDVNFKYTPTTSTKPTPTPSPTEPFARQTKIEVVTNNASPNNPWGGHQTRIVHTQDGIFTAYIVEGSDRLSRVWQLSKRQSDGTWAVIAQGDTGSNPVDLLASPDGTLHIIGWPNGIGKLWSGKPKNGTMAMTSTVIPITIPNVYQGSNSLRYSSATDASGNIVVLLSFGGKGAGGEFRWAYYILSQSQWVILTNKLDYMYTYTYLFSGHDGQVSLVATRDVPWSELGYAQPLGSVNWVFNAFRYWRTNNISSETIKVLSYAEESPTDQYPEPYLNAQTDAYLDTKDRMHILYTKKGATTGGKYEYRHRIVSASGTILLDEEIPKEAGSLCRIFQDRLERFYLLSQSGLLYPMDQEGQRLGTPIKLDLGGHQVEYSGYYLSVPRTGTPLSDAMEVVFPSDNGRSWLYFRLDFSGK